MQSKTENRKLHDLKWRQKQACAEPQKWESEQDWDPDAEAEQDPVKECKHELKMIQTVKVGITFWERFFHLL